MRRRDVRNPDMLRWYSGGGDVDRYENMTSDCRTTSEGATEFTDAKMRVPFKGYPLYYPMYGSSVTRTCQPPQYVYPVKKTSRRRFVPLAYPMPYEESRNIKPQPQIFLRDRRPSRRSLVVGPLRKPAYKVRKNHKVLVYSGAAPAQCDEKPHDARVFWRKIEKRCPGKGKVVSWCSQAIDSSTSADGKSLHSTYSRLSVDVTNEMAAMNRDIETILTRYESAFDHSILNELEERGLGKKKKHKPDVAKTALPSLTPEQQRLLAMEKPPLDRLAEIPIEYLKPRPPPSASVKEKSQETVNNSTVSGLKGMLQDLVSRGFMDKMDDTSFAKLETSISNQQAAMEHEPKGVAAPPDISKQEEVLSGATCVLQPDEKTVLSEVDKHFQSAPAAHRTPVMNVNYVVSAATKIPNLVERSEDFIPVNNVASDTNWRKKLGEVERESSKYICEKCKSVTEQPSLYKRGGSGDKLWEDKSVNTDVGVNCKEKPDGSCAKNLSSGDRNASDVHESSEGSVNQGVKSSSTPTLQDNVKKVVSNITANSVMAQSSTQSLSSGTPSSTSDDLTTNTSRAQAMTVEDAEEEERPLQRTVESTSLGRGCRSSTHPSRRYIKPTSLSSDVGTYNQKNQCASDGARVAKQGGGDSEAMETSGSKSKKDLACLVQSISAGRSPSLNNQRLAELHKSISANSAVLNSDMCLDIIRTLTELMMNKLPVGKDRKGFDFKQTYEKIRQDHLRHIQQEVAHIKYLDDISTQLPNGHKQYQKSHSASEFP